MQTAHGNVWMITLQKSVHACKFLFMFIFTIDFLLFDVIINQWANRVLKAFNINI